LNCSGALVFDTAEYTYAVFNMYQGEVRRCSVMISLIWNALELGDNILNTVQGIYLYIVKLTEYINNIENKYNYV